MQLGRHWNKEYIVGRKTEATNCVELAGFAGSARLAELAEIVVRLAELAGFAVAGAARYVELLVLG